MLRFVLYGLLFFMVIQIVRSTMRIKSNARQWRGEDNDRPKPPTINIPDIEDAKFEDLSASDHEEKGKPNDPSPKP